MLGRVVIFFMIALLGVMLPWYITVVALAIAVVFYHNPYDFIFLGFVFDELALINHEPRHHLTTTLSLLIIYIVVLIVEERLRFN